MPTDFESRMARQDDGFTVQWWGDVDLATAPLALATITQLDLGRNVNVRLRLDTVAFIDSTGVRALLQVEQHVSGTHARLELVDPSDAVVRVLELTGLGELLHLDGQVPPTLAG